MLQRGEQQASVLSRATLNRTTEAVRLTASTPPSSSQTRS